VCKVSEKEITSDPRIYRNSMDDDFESITPSPTGLMILHQENTGVNPDEMTLQCEVDHQVTLVECLEEVAADGVHHHLGSMALKVDHLMAGMVDHLEEDSEVDLEEVTADHHLEVWEWDQACTADRQ
jgi:hypothetical protein